MPYQKRYNARDFGGDDEQKMVNLFQLQRDDAKLYFLNCIKNRLDRSYKLYISDNSDRAKEIKSWQANVFVSYTNAVIETLKPRILDARPDFTIQGRTEDSQLKAPKVQSLHDFTWEIACADKTMEDVVSSSLINGMGYLQVFWKKDVRTNKFLSTNDFSSKKLKWVEKTKTFYDAPYMEWVDNYELWYDWHNTDETSKQYWFRRKLLTEEEIKRRYPLADEKRLLAAFAGTGGDLTDYAAVRNQVKMSHSKITKGSSGSLYGGYEDKYNNANIKMYEVFEWLRPFDDEYAVMVGDVPILKSKNGCIPNPYDFKETLFIGFPYLKIPGEYEGYGIPMLLENSQIMLNMIRNQRLDAATLNIHKMWIVNPLANINKEELVVRPFGIIYSQDPNGAREVTSSDIKASAYKEDDLLKGDMQYTSGVDDFSMGTGGGGSSATEVRQLRESTLERVRLYVNHLGDGLSKVMRRWTSTWKQFGSKSMTIRITGDNGKVSFPLIEQDDLEGAFDYRATVIPSLAGKDELLKKQDMDLFQLLSSVQKPGPVGPDGQPGQPIPVVDIEKLIAKLLFDFSWDYESIKPAEQPTTPDMSSMLGGQSGASFSSSSPTTKQIPPEVAQQALAMLGGGSSAPAQPFNPDGQFGQANTPINLLQNPGIPPTATGIVTPGSKDQNLRGLNKGSKNGPAKVSTALPVGKPHGATENMLNQIHNVRQ